MTTTASTRAPDTTPRATRSRRPGWRNPRLLLGTVLVAGSVVLGARLLAAADDTVGVWAVVRDVPAGATLAASDLEERRVRFPDTTAAGSYLSAGEPVAAGSVLDRPVGAGELLPRAALATGAGPDLVEVPVSVAADDLPATVRQGSVVDVWVAPGAAGPGTAGLATAGTAGDRRAPGDAVAVLREVVVVAVPRTSDGLAPQVTRQVIVGVPEERAADLGTPLGDLTAGRVVIVRVG